MRINHNIAAIKSNIKLSRTNDNMSKSIERLSSGYRINRAADDAAGMAISQKMKMQIRGLEQAADNASDGVSILQTAEGAMNEIESMLQRMRELSVLAVNETNTNEDREHIQLEIDQLKSEINRISEDTEFNSRKLLNGEADRLSYTDNNYVQVVSVSEGVEAKEYSITVEKVAQKASVVSKSAPADLDQRAPKSGILSINGETISIEAGESFSDIYSKIKKLGEQVDVVVDLDGDAGVMKYTAKYAGSKNLVEIACLDSDGSGSELAEFLGLHDVDVNSGENLEGKYDASAEGGIKVAGTDTDIEFEKGFGDEPTAAYTSDGNNVTIYDVDGFEMKLKVKDDVTEDSLAEGELIGINVLDAGPIVLQVGANENQTIIVGIPKIDTTTLGLEELNLRNTDGASEAITALDNAINKVSAARAKLGAYDNRLEHCISNLESADENMTQSLSRIEDLDMAEEMSKYTQYSVLQQAGTSMLAHANEMPQTILNLLQG